MLLFNIVIEFNKERLNRKMKKLIMLIILISIGIWTISSSNNPTFDAFNPFLSDASYYSVVNKDPFEANAKYTYHFKAYDKKGKEQDVVISTTRRYPKGTYVYLLSKGRYGQYSTEIKTDEIPSAAKLKLGIE
mgnify:CR=1 FL=1